MRRSSRGLWLSAMLVGGIGACGEVAAPRDAAGQLGDAGPADTSPGDARADALVDGPPGTLCVGPASQPTTTSQIDLFTSAEGRSGPDLACPSVGSSSSTTNPQFVWCRRWGGEVRVGADFNHWWLWTELDDPPMQRGWISAYYILNQGNDEANDKNTRLPIPDCP